MAEDDNILFVRGRDDECAEDIWDDSALIKAYDKAINLAKEEVAKRMGIELQAPETKHKKSHSHKQSHHSKKPIKKWVVGSPCRAIYSEDGELYEAIITKIYDNTKMCSVKFIGYNNKEKVELSSLVESDGLQSQIAQTKEAEAAAENSNAMDFKESQKINGMQNLMDCETNENKSFGNMFMPGPSFNPLDSIPPAPPLPPQLMARLPENDDDALSSMLMSWYISGFHTGYYHGYKQAQNKPHQRKK